MFAGMSLYDFFSGYCLKYKRKCADIDSFKKAVEGVHEWFVEQLKDAGYDDGQELVDLFAK